MKISRRMMLAGGVGAACAAGAAAVGGRHHWRRLRQPSAGDLAGLLRERLGHLPLDEGGVDAFAQEYVRRYGASPMSVHHERTLGGVLRLDAALRLAPAELRQEILDFERHLVSRYLLSTTYFRAPRGEPVRYLAFADPYEMGCANPLAQFTINE